MNDIVLSLIVIALTGVVVAAIFVLTKRAKKQQLERIESLARRKGWQFEAIKEPLSNGYRMKGGNWTLEALKIARGQSVEPQQSNISSETIFKSNSLYLPGRNMLVGPKPAQVNLGGFGEMLKQKLIQTVLGDSGKGMAEVQSGSSTFRERFMTLANDPEDARRILTPQVEQLLMKFEAKKPVLKVTQAGLEIKLDNDYLEKDEDIINFVELGEALLKTR